MLRIEVVRDKGIVIITPDGKLETADFDRLAAEVDPVISANGMLNGLMVYARAFPGWSDFAAFAAHIRFITGHRGKVRRAAVVSDSALLAWAPAVAKPIVGAEVRHFPAAEKDQALAWLEKGFQRRAFGMTFLKIEPKFDSLRSDPRFADLLRRVGLL